MTGPEQRHEQLNRLMIGLTLFGLIVCTIYVGGWLFTLVIGLLGLIGLGEISQTIWRQTGGPNRSIVLIGANILWTAAILVFWSLRSFSPETCLQAILSGGGYDTFAYLIGKRWGVRRIAPYLSPEKTVLGTVAGIIASLTIGTAAWQMHHATLITTDWLILGFATILAPIGDFSFSWCKRRLGVKDWGLSLGKHGGVPDRANAILAVSPVYLIASYWFGR